MEWARLRLGQENQKQALLGDAAAHGAMSDNEEENEKCGKNNRRQPPVISGDFYNFVGA